MFRRFVFLVVMVTAALLVQNMQLSLGNPSAPARSPAGGAALVGVPTQRAGAGASPLPGQARLAQDGAITAPSVPVTMVIPRLGVRAPVYDGGVDGQGQLLMADGYDAITHFRYSAAPGAAGNYIAYGHDDIHGNVLRYLSRLRPGDTIALYQGGELYVYLVAGSRVVQPTDLSVLQPTLAATLTLISCTPYLVDTQRIVVTATLALADRQHLPG